MKRSVAFLLALLLTGLLSACGPRQMPQINAEPEALRNASAGTVEPSSPSEAPAVPAPVYFVIRGHLVGSWEDGAWRSLNDPGGRSESEYSNDFYFKEILSVPRFTLYSRNGRLGCSAFALVNGGEGVSGFEGGDKTALFAPYAKPDSGNLWPYSMEVPLPAAFGPELNDLMIPDYGYYLRFSYENIDLATNSAADLNPYATVNWMGGAGATDGDHAALAQRLAENGIYGETHFTDGAVLDIDGDGEPEVLLFANTPRDEGGYLKLSPEDGGSYSVILLRRADGSYQTVFERYLPYTPDVTAHFNISGAGIFDMNTDKKHEICAVMGEWEGGYTFVLSLNEKNGWGPVLRANWGM